MKYLSLLIAIWSVFCWPTISYAGQLEAERAKLSTTMNGWEGAPALVPIGGMIAIMPTIHANAWQPPASGSIKDGFMRADGHLVTAQNVTDGSLFPAGTYLPNMVSMVARGGSTSCDGSIACQSKVGGNDSATLSMNNIPQHNHGSTGLSGGMDHTVFEHSHADDFSVDSLGTTNKSLSSGSASGGTWSFGDGSASGGTWSFGDGSASGGSWSFANGSASGGSWSISGTASADTNSRHSHDIKYSSATNDWLHVEGNFATNGTFPVVLGYTGSTGLGRVYADSNSNGIDSAHSHGVTGSATRTGNSTVTGTVSRVNSSPVTGTVSRLTASTVTGAVSRTGNSTVTGTTDISHSHGLSGSVGADNFTTGSKAVSIGGNTANAGQASPTAVDTLPNYQSVVWVIRVY